MLKDDAIKLKFLLGLPVPIEGIGNFSVPMISKIAEITEELWNMATNALLFSKKNYTDIEGIEDYTSFQLLNSIIMQDESFRELFFIGLNLYFDTSPTVDFEQGIVYFGELSDDSLLTEDKLNYIQRLVKIALSIEEKEEDEIVAGNEQARKFMERLRKRDEERKKRMMKKKQPVDLHSITSAVGWKAESFDFINQLNYYQLYDGYWRLGVIDNYEHTMRGIYSGTVDASKIKLPEINWANILKNN